MSQGADIDLHARLLPGLTWRVSAGYTDAHYSQTVTMASGVILARAGEPLPIPKVSGSTALDFERALFASEHTAYVNLTYDYAGSYDRNPPTGVFGADPTTQYAIAVHSLSMRGGVRFGGMDFSLFADNVTNSSPELLRFHETNASIVYRGRTLRPRTIGLTAIYGF